MDDEKGTEVELRGEVLVAELVDFIPVREGGYSRRQITEAEWAELGAVRHGGMVALWLPD